MDNLLIDRETLGKFVDALIKQKPFQASNAKEQNAMRENTIKSLDDKISADIFGQLTEEQDAELNRILDSGDESEATFQEFFKNANINLANTIAQSMREFATSYLEGGRNV